ncbi:MAG: GAF domain-containing protein [Gammaproteobacteria bacterium]|nr:GAF domain-containing protein [Gammaproteobacteria bacterium]
MTTGPGGKDRRNAGARVVYDLLERRFKDQVLASAVGALSAAEREVLLRQIDDLARQLDSLIEATRKVREPLSFDLMLTRLIALITEAFDAERSSLFLYDSETEELFSRVAQGELTREIRFPADSGIAGQVFQDGRSAIIDDAYADPRFNQAVDAETGYRTRNILCVPLRARNGEVIGVTEVLNKRGGDFSAADCALLQAFTTHTASVLESAHLTERARESLREEAHILAVTQAVSSELDIDKLLRKIIGIATDLLEAERSTLFLHDPDSGELWSRVAEGIAEREIRIPAAVGIAGEVFTTRRAVNIPDAYADPRFNPAVDRKTGYRTRSILCVPVINKHGVAVGVVQVLNRRGGPFRPRDQRRLEMLAAQSAIALDNARLFREVLDERNYSENVLRSLSDAVVTLDTAYNVVKLNEAASRLFRLPASDVLGAPAYKLFGRDNAWVLEVIHKVVNAHTTETVLDGVLTRRDDTQVSVNLAASPLADGDGETLGCTLILEDVTEDKRVRATMARYMTAKVAEQVLAEGEAVLGGRSQPATILFSDIRGFSTIAERLGAQATVSLLNEYFTEMVEVVFEYNGILDKYIGDAIMAVFGTPFPSDDDADNAVRVAIRMQEVLATFNARRRAAGQPIFETRIGINSGDVVAGNIGSARRMDYTVIGDGVNAAARLESANKQLGTRILISGSTRALLRGQYRLRELDLIRVKGRVAPIPVFEVRGLGRDIVSAAETRLLEVFASGLACYRDQDWDGAVDCFDTVLGIEAGDQPSWRLRARALHYRAHPPSPQWDGVWTLDEK